MQKIKKTANFVSNVMVVLHLTRLALSTFVLKQLLNVVIVFLTN